MPDRKSFVPDASVVRLPVGAASLLAFRWSRPPITDACIRKSKGPAAASRSAAPASITRRLCSISGLSARTVVITVSMLIPLIAVCPNTAGGQARNTAIGIATKPLCPTDRSGLQLRGAGIVVRFTSGVRCKARAEMEGRLLRSAFPPAPPGARDARVVHTLGPPLHDVPAAVSTGVTPPCQPLLPSALPDYAGEPILWSASVRSAASMRGDLWLQPGPLASSEVRRNPGTMPRNSRSPGSPW